MAASIYGPPAHKRRRKRAPGPETGKTTPMQLFWLVVVAIVCFAFLINSDEDAPEIEETLRQLERMQRLNESYRPLDPALFELPSFEPIPMPAPIGLEVLPAPIEPPPAEPAQKPRKKTTRRTRRPAPEQ